MAITLRQLTAELTRTFANLEMMLILMEMAKRAIMILTSGHMGAENMLILTLYAEQAVVGHHQSNNDAPF